MRLANPPKALIALIALLCITVLLAIGSIEAEAGLGLMGLIIGYSVGNGIAAKHGDPIQPIFDTKRRDRRSTDHPQGGNCHDEDSETG